MYLVAFPEKNIRSNVSFMFPIKIAQIETISIIYLIDLLVAQHDGVRTTMEKRYRQNSF